MHLAPHISKEDDRGDRTRGVRSWDGGVSGCRRVGGGAVGGGGVVCCRSRQTSG